LDAEGTVTRFLARLQRGEFRLHAKSLVMVQEAGLIGANRLAPLKAVTQVAGARLVLSMDSLVDPDEVIALLKEIKKAGGDTTAALKLAAVQGYSVLLREGRQIYLSSSPEAQAVKERVDDYLAKAAKSATVIPSLTPKLTILEELVKKKRKGK